MLLGSRYGGPWVFSATFVLLCSCAANTDKPLTDDKFSWLLRSEIKLSSIENPKSWLFYEINSSIQAKQILEVLMPGESGRRGTVPMENVDFVFTYSTGKNPYEFHVDVDSKNIVYQEGDYVYTGGSSSRFKELIDKLASADGVTVRGLKLSHPEAK